MTPEQFEKALIQIYLMSQKVILRKIEKITAKGGPVEYERAVLDEIGKIISKLDKEAGKFAGDVIPLVYRSGIDDTVNALNAYKGIHVASSGLMVKLHQDAIENLANNYFNNMAASHRYVARRFSDIFRQAQIEAAIQRMTTGSTLDDAKKILLFTLHKKGIAGFEDKAGRQWSLKHYAEMATRTATAEAYTAGTLNTMEELGFDLVMMSKHRTACPLCQHYEGKVFDRSGKHPDYPPLTYAMPNGYTIHPNCRHAVTPWIEELMFDDEIKEAKEAVKNVLPQGNLIQTREYQEKMGEYRAWLKEDGNKGKRDTIKIEGREPDVKINITKQELDMESATYTFKDNIDDIDTYIKSIVSKRNRSFIKGF